MQEISQILCTLRCTFPIVSFFAKNLGESSIKPRPNPDRTARISFRSIGPLSSQHRSIIEGVLLQVAIVLLKTTQVLPETTKVLLKTTKVLPETT